MSFQGAIAHEGVDETQPGAIAAIPQHRQKALMRQPKQHIKQSNSQYGLFRKDMELLILAHTFSQSLTVNLCGTLLDFHVSNSGKALNMPGHRFDWTVIIRLSLKFG